MTQGIRCPQIPRFAKYIRHLLLQVIDTLRTEVSSILYYYFIPSIPIVRLRKHSITVCFCFLICCVRHNTFRLGILMAFIYAVVIHIVISYCFGLRDTSCSEVSLFCISRCCGYAVQRTAVQPLQFLRQ